MESHGTFRDEQANPALREANPDRIVGWWFRWQPTIEAARSRRNDCRDGRSWDIADSCLTLLGLVK